MKDLQVNLFGMSRHRLPIAFGNLRQMSKLPQHHKDRMLFKVFCLADQAEEWKTELVASGIDHEVDTNSVVYMDRTLVASNNPYKYSIRLDDDMFVGTVLWTFMLDHMDTILSQEQVHAFCPIFNTGIPSVDYFVEDFLSKEDAEAIGEIFKRDSVPRQPWHLECDYLHLQEFIKALPKWDADAYWKEVAKHNTVFHSIHPIRFSLEANTFLTDRILANFNKILEEQDYSFMDTSRGPNTHFFSFRTSNWQQALKHKYDSFDEISMFMNEYKNKMHTIYVRHGFGIHACQGYVPNRVEMDTRYADFISKL